MGKELDEHFCHAFAWLQIHTLHLPHIPSSIDNTIVDESMHFLRKMDQDVHSIGRIMARDTRYQPPCYSVVSLIRTLIAPAMKQQKGKLAVVANNRPHAGVTALQYKIRKRSELAGVKVHPEQKQRGKFHHILRFEPTEVIRGARAQWRNNAMCSYCARSLSVAA